MDLRSFLFSYDGRSNRFKYWMALIFTFASLLCVIILVTLLFGSGPGKSNFALGELVQISGRPAGDALSWALTILMSGFVTWTLSAAAIKRLHDRNKSGWWIVPLLIAPILLGKISDRLDAPAMATVVDLTYLALCLWGFIELGFRKGTVGPNRFGADPLAPVDTRPGWDQSTELEMVPYSAGPSPRTHGMRGHD
jgi:uncharacterized membrane protein YhaH (DUF805 family)